MSINIELTPEQHRMLVICAVICLESIAEIQEAPLEDKMALASALEVLGNAFEEDGRVPPDATIN